MAKSSVSAARGKAGKSNKGNGKPDKPYAEFPLVSHRSGHWCKKIRGKIHYFGAWGKRVGGKLVWIDGEGNWKPALEKYKEQADDLYAGRTPRKASEGDGVTVALLAERFLNAKRRRQESGEIGEQTFRDYKRVCDRLVEKCGKRLVSDLRPDDFENLRAAIAKKCGPVRLGNEVRQTRMIFKYGWDSGLLERPMRFGQSFDPPTKTVLRKHKVASGPKMFQADEIRRLLDAATSPQIRAMILLGINCGFGNGDCGSLPQSALDLKAGWIDFPRPKTAIERRCPLWPETIEALQQAIEIRPKAKDEANTGLVFITKYGDSWAKNSSSNPISAEFRKLLQRPRCPKCNTLRTAKAEDCECGWKPRGKDTWTSMYRPGLGFYGLRHSFETAASGTRDQVAINHIMGHADHTMAATYREHIEDDRLRAVVEHVWGWLFEK